MIERKFITLNWQFSLRYHDVYGPLKKKVGMTTEDYLRDVARNDSSRAFRLGINDNC